jgi:hypothetical protein
MPIVRMGGSIIPILIAKADHELIDGLRTSGALSVEQAQGLEPSKPLVVRRLKSLLQAGVIRETSPGSRTYYLDESAWDQFRRQRRMTMIITVGIVLAVILVLIAFAGPRVKQ